MKTTHDSSSDTRKRILFSLTIGMASALAAAVLILFARNGIASMFHMPISEVRNPFPGPGFIPLVGLMAGALHYQSFLAPGAKKAAGEGRES